MANKPDPDVIAEYEHEIEELQSKLARHSHSAASNRRHFKKAHENLRTLENEVRRHVFGQCECKSWRECSVRIGKLIPIKERAKAK
jgi:hypothetical protein